LKMSSINCFVYTILALCLCAGVYSHGFMKSPLARHALFELPDSEKPPNWWDHTYWDAQGVWCGNVDQDVAVSTCGRCGDPPGGADFNLGGVYGLPVITGNYTAGSTIRVDLEFGAMHYGYMEVELCPVEVESDGCFTRLEITGGSQQVRLDNRMCLPLDGTTTRHEYATVRLPAGIRCNRCTLRWTYRTAYPGPVNWDPCFNGEPAQTFRNCANIAIR